MKKIISILLASLMIVGMSVSVLADEEQQNSDLVEFENEIDTSLQIPEKMEESEKEIIDFDDDIVFNPIMKEEEEVEIELDLSPNYSKEFHKEYDADVEVYNFKGTKDYFEKVELENEKDYYVVDFKLKVVDDEKKEVTVEKNVTPSIINQAYEGDTVLVNLMDSDAKVNHETFDKAYEKNVTLEIAGEGFQWTFDPEKVNMSGMKSHFELGVNVDSGINTSMKKELNEQGVDTSDVQVIKTEFHGEFDGEVELKVKVDKDLRNKKELNIYYWNEETKKPELLAESVKVEKGYVILNLTHCSRYMITDKKVAGVKVETVEKFNPSTGADIYFVDFR